MLYISAQPATMYYGWQIATQLYSYRNVGVDMSKVYTICSVDKKPDPIFKKLIRENKDANFLFYPDTRLDKSYVSSIRPHIIKKFYIEENISKKQVIYYSDCDTVFTQTPDFSNLIYKARQFFSDTNHYLNYDYVKSKGNDVLKLMLDIANIKEEFFKSRNTNSGGAQYVLRNLDGKFWDDVEVLSTKLYKQITKLNSQKLKDNPDYHTLQIWCADMWALLFCLWKNGLVSEVAGELHFNWPNQLTSDIQDSFILHNAGVLSNQKSLFYKGNYMNELPPLDLSFPKENLSYVYYEMVKKALKGL